MAATGQDIFDKVRLPPDLDEALRIVNPWWRGEPGRPIPPFRRHAFGLLLRRLDQALARQLQAGLDDLMDACAACWTAERIARGDARSFPEPPELDSMGLPIAIWA